MQKGRFGPVSPYTERSCAAPEGLEEKIGKAAEFRPRPFFSILLDCEFEAPPFHAKTFEKARHGHGPYAAWPEPKRHEYLNRFLGIIARRCFKSFGTLLEKSVYERIIRRHRAFEAYFYSPFVFAAVNTVHALREWRDDVYPGQSLNIIFDRGNKNEGQLNEVAKRALVGSEKNIKDVAVADDEERPPLRAADLLAFELCAEGRNACGQRTNFSRYALLQLDAQPHEWVGIREEALLKEIATLIGDDTFKVEV